MAKATKEDRVILELSEEEARYLKDIMDRGPEEEFKKSDYPSFSSHLDVNIWQALDDIL